MKTINLNKKLAFIAIIALGFLSLRAEVDTGVREYYDVDALDDLEDEEIAFYQDSSQWRGTVWLKGVDETQTGGTKLNHLGNADSTIRFTNCDFWIPRDYSVTVPMEFVDDNGEDSDHIPAFFINGLSTGIYRLASIRGDGTFKIRDRNGSNSAFIIEDVSAFTGSLDTDRPVFMGATTGYRGTSGWIEIPANKTVTIYEGKYFSSAKILVNGTLVVKGALNGTVEGSGTVILPETIANGANIGVYGCANSTIRFANDFSGRFSSGCTIPGDLDLGGNTIELTDGYSTTPYVINRLVGDGVLNVSWATKQPIRINNVLADDGTTIAYKGRIIGNANITLPSGYRLDTRGHIVPTSANHHYVTVPKTATDLFTPVATNATRQDVLENVESINPDFYVYRVPDGNDVRIDFECFANVVIDEGASYVATVTEDCVAPLPAGHAAGFRARVDRGAYVHEVWYDENWVSPTDQAMPEPPPLPAAFSCSAVRNGNFVGRNLDYFVNDMPMFIVHMGKTEDRLASVGTASAKLHEGDLGNYTCEYALPPLGMFDGINEKGVVVEMNVVPLGDAGALTGTNPGKSSLHLAYVPRYVLDHATSAKHAIELLEERNLVGDLLGRFSLHYLISDKDESYVVEFINGKLAWRHMEISTNFNLCWNNESKTAITDETEGAWTKDDYPVPYDPATTLEEIGTFYSPGAQGVERFITLRNHYSEGNTLEGMVNLMRRVRYSQTYSLETAEENFTDGPSWWVTESCMAGRPAIPYGTDELGNVRVLHRGIKDLYGQFKTDYDTFTNVIYAVDMAFGQQVLANIESYRHESTGICYTTHTVTYDIAKRTFRLYLQEDDETPYDFELSTPGRITESGLKLEDGKVVFKATMSSVPTVTYALKRTSDLTTPLADWETIATATAVDVILEFVDPNPPERQAFYTVVSAQ